MLQTYSTNTYQLQELCGKSGGLEWYFQKSSLQSSPPKYLEWHLTESSDSILVRDASKSVAWIHLHPLILVDVAPGSSQYRISAGGFELPETCWTWSFIIVNTSCCWLLNNKSALISRVITWFVLLRQQVELFIFYLKSIRKFSSALTTSQW